MTTIISDDEREKQVLDLYYNQRKNTRDTAKIMRMSFTKEERERREKERQMEIARQKKNHSYNNNDDDGNGNGKAEQQHHQIIPSTSSASAIPPSLPSAAELEGLSDKQKAVMAYKLYDQGKSPVQVATTLCLTAKEAMIYHREFWELKRLDKLYRIYPEIEPYLYSFIELHKECKRYGLNGNNIKDFVYDIKIGAIELPEVSDEYETTNFKLEEVQNQLQEGQNQLNDITYQKQQVEKDIQYQKRMAQIDLKNVRKDIANLMLTQDQLQQSVDSLGKEMMRRVNENRKLEEFSHRFKRSDENYLKIKEVAKEHITNSLNSMLKVSLNLKMK